MKNVHNLHNFVLARRQFTRVQFLQALLRVYHFYKLSPNKQWNILSSKNKLISVCISIHSEQSGWVINSVHLYSLCLIGKVHSAVYAAVTAGAHAVELE